jgi:hypothetical protein
MVNNDLKFVVLNLRELKINVLDLMALILNESKENKDLIQIDVKFISMRQTFFEV